MSFWRQITRGLHGLLHRTQQDREIDDEVRHYFEEATAAHRERGLSEEDARRAARLEFGNPHAAEEQVRSFGWEDTVRRVFSDLRFAARQLRKNPGFTLVNVMTLAIGIGASTAIFSAVNPVLFKPLPYPHSDQIMMIWNTYQGERFEAAFGTYLELLQRSRSFDSMSVFEPWQPALTGGTHPQRLEGQSVSASFFPVLGVSPSLGRNFEPSEDTFRGPKVVILSDKLWQQQFQGDRAILGRQIKLNDDNYTVIGIMPHGFGDVLSPSAQVWTTEQYDTSQIARDFNTSAWGDHLRIVARLKPGVTRAQGIQDLDLIVHNPWPQFPRPRWASLRQGLMVDSLVDDIAHTVKPALLAVLGAVILVLAIACGNVVSLVLARSDQRAGEFAVRGALGASKHRIIRQLVTESLMLTFLGGALGIGVALAGVSTIVALSPAELPRLDAIAVDPQAFLFALAITTVIGLTAGLVPALHISRDMLQRGLQQGSTRTVGGHARTRRTLVVTEVAFAFVLLVSAGLLLHSMERLLAVDPGFNPPHLLTLQVQSFGHQFDDPASAPGAGALARGRFFEQALDAVRRVPGVEEAAFTSLLPLSDDPQVDAIYGSHFEDEDTRGGRNVFRYAVSPDYCQTMGIPLRVGRFLDEHDNFESPHVAMISESVARSHFPGQDPLGKRLKVGPNDQPWFTIVGVVGDVKQTSLAMEQTAAVYIPAGQSWFADQALSFVVRARGDAAELAPSVKDAIWSVDKDQPIVRVMTMKRMMALGEAERRFVLILFELFGVVALLLAAVGLYGVLSGSVAERTREIGVRVALGATRRHILSLILGDGMRLTGFGMAIGVCGSVAATREISSLLFGTSPLDPFAWIGMILVLTTVACIACLAPAWRAVRVDPSVTLRAE